MSLQIALCAPPAEAATVLPLIQKHLGLSSNNLFVGHSVADFEATKKANTPVALVVVPTPVSAEVIRSMCDDHASATRRVRWIYSLSAGVDAYKLKDASTELANIPIYNAQGCFSQILAEHVLFSMLHFNRQPWRLVASKAAKLWDQYNMVGLRGQKVGIFGYGDIGRACGRAAAAMGMEVTGIRRTASDVDVDEYGVRVRTDAAADEVIRTSDFIVGVLPGTPSTAHFFNRDFFSRMKPSAVFINIGRGATQCEDDLVQALQAGTIRGAALDVFEKEPLPESSPLWNLPDDKVLLSAHCADRTADIFQITCLRFCSLFDEYMKTGAINTYRVDLHKGY